MFKLMTGNEAVAQGAYEAGVSYAVAYPGTPSTEILESIADYEEIIAEWAPNEKVALECAIGASIAGIRSLSSMKMVGVNVAADPLFNFAYSGVNAGMVLISADDPGIHSSQNEQDNRYYSKFAKIAMLEPSDSQECKDMVSIAMDISERFDIPVMLRMTTRTCHSKSRVKTGMRKIPVKKPYAKNTQKYDLVPVVSRLRHESLEKRLKELELFSNVTELNYTEMFDNKIGIITAGVAYQYAKEVFGEHASYLKLGFSYPLPLEKIRAFAECVETVCVIEELEPFIEEQLKAAGIRCIGKAKLPVTGELTPDIIAKCFLGDENLVINYDKTKLANRPPILCAGCPHRGFYYELSKIKNIMITGDIGCYGMGGNDPLYAKDTTICMGSSISMGHGAQKAFELSREKLRIVSTIGDSTFFHTGINSLMHVAYNRGNTINCILDNLTTGMTGHQENPGTGYTLQKAPTKIVDIKAIVNAIGIEHVRIINPLRLDEVKDAFDWALNLNEASVIITRWPCVLKKLSAQDKKEFSNFIGKCRVDETNCTGCKLCIKIGCPAIRVDTESRKVKIDDEICRGCEVCLQVCKFNAVKKVG